MPALAEPIQFTFSSTREKVTYEDKIQLIFPPVLLGFRLSGRLGFRAEICADGTSWSSQGLSEQRKQRMFILTFTKLLRNFPTEI